MNNRVTLQRALGLGPTLLLESTLVTGFWICIGFVVGFGGDDKWAFSMGEAGVVCDFWDISGLVLLELDIVGVVTVCCCTASTFTGVEFTGVDGVPLSVVFWLGIDALTAVARTRMPS